jgi:hypothetical protein
VAADLLRQRSHGTLREPDLPWSPRRTVAVSRKKHAADPRRGAPRCARLRVRRRGRVPQRLRAAGAVVPRPSSLGRRLPEGPGRAPRGPRPRSPTSTPSRCTAFRSTGTTGSSTSGRRSWRASPRSPSCLCGRPSRRVHVRRRGGAGVRAAPHGRAPRRPRAAHPLVQPLRFAARVAGHHAPPRGGGLVVLPALPHGPAARGRLAQARARAVRRAYACFTPEVLGVAPHHTSPPRCVSDYADFCARMTRRYAG